MRAPRRIRRRGVRGRWGVAREDTSGAGAQGGPEPQVGPGTRIGEYVVEGLLGSGTFGIVYRGIQPLIGKQVAIKLLSRRYSADPTVVSRFVAEARAVNQIAHRNIIDIFSFGQLDDGRHYYVMELLAGETLDETVQRHGGRLEPQDLFPILRGLARALDAAHAAGIAHRDLKPANVFLTRDEEGRPSPKLLDFGVAKLLTDDLPRQHTTASGAAVGTPDYMSPEQCRGPDVDHRTDVYAFGVMAYQLLSGQLPFQGETVVEVLMKHMTEDPVPPSARSPHVPPALDGPILAMMAKRSEDRPTNLYTAVLGVEEAAREAGMVFPAAGQSADRNPTDTAKTFGSGPQPGFSSQGAHRTPWELLAAIGAIGLAVAVVPFFIESAPEYRAASPASADATPGVAKQERPPPSSETRVRLFIAGAPEGTRVLGPGDLVLGVAPGPVRIIRSETPVELRFEAPGYRTLRREVRPVASSTVSIRLVRVRRHPPKAKRPGKDDLEVPNWEASR